MTKAEGSDSVNHIGSNQPQEIVDVAIIGAGISGVYYGWHLISSDICSNQILKPIAQNRSDGRLRICAYLYYILRSEAYNFVLDSVGYYSILSNWNAGKVMA